MNRKKKPVTKKNGAPKFSDLDVEQRRLAILKQKQCDSVALHIVQKLIDCPVDEDVFLQSLKYMNKCHYQDIVEERALSKMCGYPICGSKIPDMPTKKFHISTKSNKVYDITERKNYCSNYCYKAGTFIKEQMLTSPLWFRDKEEIPNFHLLPKTETGVPGQEIDQGIAKVVVNEDANFTSVTKFAQDMMNDLPSDTNVEATIKDETKTNEIIDIQEQENIKNNKQTDESYYTNLYMPNLADILKQNAEYFENESDVKSNSKTNLDKTVINKESNIILIDKSAKDIINNNDQPSTSKSTNIKIGFDRTVINKTTNKVEEIPSETINVKGILSKKRKSKHKTHKKNVSFSANHSEKYFDKNESIQENPFNDSDEKPLHSALDSNPNKKTYKNENLIGSVQEKSHIYSYDTANKYLELYSQDSKDTNEITQENDNDRKYKQPLKSTTDSDANPKIYKNENLIGSVQEKSHIYKFEPTNKELVVQNDKDKLDAEENVKNMELKTKIITFSDNKNPEINQNIQLVNSSVTDNCENNTNTKTIESAIVEEKINQIKDTNVNITDENKQKRLNKLKNSASYKKANKLSKPTPMQIQNVINENINIRLKKCVQEWLTIETALYLYGEEYVKKEVSDKVFKQYLNRKKNIELDDSKQKQYDSICKRLNVMELSDRKFDESVTGKKRRPLPRYDELREQADTLDLRVKAFYSGCFEVFEEDGESETDSVKDEEEPYIVKGAPAVLPLVDSKDIALTRRKIFLTSLSRTIPNICEILQQCPNSLFSDIKNLVDTFEFSANNIVFKTIEWNLVAFVLLKMLSVRDSELKESLQSKDALLYVSSLANQFDMEENEIEEVLLKTTDVQNFVDICIRNNFNT